MYVEEGVRKEFGAYGGRGLAPLGSRAAMARVSRPHTVAAAPAAALNSSRLDAVETRVRRACDSGPSVGENCFPSEGSPGKLIFGEGQRWRRRCEHVSLSGVYLVVRGEGVVTLTEEK